MTCQWPIGDPKESDFRFCDDPDVVDGKPYCLPHCNLAYVKYKDYSGRPFVFTRSRILASSLETLDAE